MRVYISHIWEEETPAQIEPILVADIRDIITCVKLGHNRFKLQGLGSTEGQSSPFPINFNNRPCDTRTLEAIH